MIIRYKLAIFFLSFSVIMLSCKVTRNSIKSDIVLKIQQSSGINATSVVWNPEKKMYYTFYGGNESFPLEVFDEKGKSLRKTSVGFDARGVWWNSITQQIEGNSFSNHGIVAIELTDKGFPKETKIVIQNNEQPDDQSCGVFDFDKNELIYYYNDTVYRYNRKNGKYINHFGLSGIAGYFKCINKNALIYTNYAKKEIAIFNFCDKQIYLFDKSNGQLSETVLLPANAPSSDIYRFSFANQRIWLYNKTKREWMGFLLIR